MERDSNLKLCPFCGGEGKLYTFVSDGIPKRSAANVYCKKCSAKAAIFEDSEHDGKYIFKAVEAWNRRAEG